MIDPFGGIAAGAYDAMRFGLHWIGCELELKFVEFGRQNILKWNAEHNANFKKWGSATLLQGDSRRLCEILRTDAECVVSSPPFGEGETRDRRKPGRGMVAYMMSRAYTQDNQGKTDGNLAAMREGDFSASISSPPYAQSIHDGNGIDSDKLTGNPAGQNSQAFAEGYGKSDGQLAAMPEGQFDASVSSPPYEDQNACNDKKYFEERFSQGGKLHSDYSETAGQIGVESGETFWSAAKQIVEQTYAALKPGGHAIWVVKDYVRNKERVPFCERWMLLCESVGFKTLHWHRAWLVEDYGTQQDLLGAHQKNIRERKSFFRRNHEYRVQAEHYWKNALNDEERFIWFEMAKNQIWTEYADLISKQNGTADNELQRIIKVCFPTHRKIILRAQKNAYEDFSRPEYSLNQIISYEVVLCMEKK